MKLNVITFLVVAFAIAVYLYKRPKTTVKALQSQVRTSVKINNQTFDYGVVKPGDTAVAKFTIVNTGNQNLYIEDVNPECHCTVAQLSKTSVSPADSIIITAKIIEQSPIGFHRKLITVKANIEKSPFVLIAQGRYQ